MTYLSSQEILYIHSRIVSELGGRQGIKDTTTLKKAISYIHNKDIFPDKFKKAGALFFAMAKKKPFFDFNTPTAIAVTKIFLQLNKYDLNIEKIEEFIENILPNAKVEDISQWLQENSNPIKKD